MAKTEVINLSRQMRSASVQPESFSADDNTVDLIWTTGADVVRFDPIEGFYLERLSTDPGNVRLGRLNQGAPFLDTHNSYQLSNVIGSVVPGSARMEDGRGLATVKLSSSARAADTVQDIRDGVIRNVSVAYSVFAYTCTESGEGLPPVMLATDWEPFEVSAVPVPADPGCGIRSAKSETSTELNQCIITRTHIEEDMNKKTIAGDVNKRADDKDCDEDEKAARAKARAEDDKDSEKDEDEDKRSKRTKRDDTDDEDEDKDSRKRAKRDDDADDADEDEDDDADEDKDSRKRAKRDDDDDADEDEGRSKRARSFERALDKDRKRSAEILTLGRKHKLDSLAITHVERGTSVKSFALVCLEAIETRGAPDKGPSIGATTIGEPSLRSKDVDWASAAALRKSSK